MFKRNDVIEVQAPDGSISRLRFLENAYPVHGSEVKYMAAVEADTRPGQQLLIKYAGDFSGQKSAADLAMDLIVRQSEMQIQSPFVARTVLSGDTKCRDVFVVFLVMEKVTGDDLKSYMDKMSAVLADDPAELLRLKLDLGRQLLLGIRAYARQYSESCLIHRDLKPENIIIQSYTDSYGLTKTELKIIDFDLMVSDGQIMNEHIIMGGTIGYAHPDADDEGTVASHAWDLYAAGLILYELFEGKKHFEDDAYMRDLDLAFTLKGMPSCRDLPELIRIIEKLVACKYADIEDVLTDYQTMLESWYGVYCYENFCMDQFLECRPGFEGLLPYARIHTKISSEGLLDCVQTFRVCDGMVTRLVYGENIIGADAVLYKKDPEPFGAFGMINGHICFIPYMDECRAAFLPDAAPLQENIITANGEISFRDVTIKILNYDIQEGRIEDNAEDQ